jgi:APA family basic amino acid/polyamine antiporter
MTALKEPSVSGAPDGAPKQILSLYDCVAIIVGLVIGTGIFSFPSIVAGVLGQTDAILMVWLAGGIVSIIGALCYAELATAYPSAGGEYHFLTRAYGANVGFMFAWARLTVIQSGSIALFAFIFGDYATQMVSLGPYSSSIYAALTIVLLTALNLSGVRQTTNFQSVLFVATMCGLGVLILASVLGTPSEAIAPTQAPQPLTMAGIGTAMLLVLLTFGGWNEAAYISAEVKNPKRNMVRALLIAITIITVIYMAVNFAYLAVLGPEGMAASKAIAADVMRAAFGDVGAVVMTFIVLVLILDNTNITLFTGARSAYALGRDFSLFRALAKWDEARGVPTRGVLFQSAIALAIVFFGAFARQSVQTVVDYLQPVFWVFFLLTGLSLFVLRQKNPSAELPFRVPLYPVTPALFCLTCAYMLYSSLSYAAVGALAGLGVLALGLPLLWFARQSRNTADPAANTSP